MGRPILVRAAWQARESLLSKDHRDGRGSAANVLGIQSAADVVDGQILFTQHDDTFPDAVALGRRSRLLAGLDEEPALRGATELVAEDAEAAGRIAKALGGRGGGDAVDKKSAQGFILAVRRVAWLEECSWPIVLVLYFY